MKKKDVNTVLDIVIFLLMLALFFMKGDLHETLAYTLGVLIIAHIVLHWKQFKGLYTQLIPGATYQILTAAVISVLVVGILTAPLYLSGAREGPHGDRETMGQVHSERD